MDDVRIRELCEAIYMQAVNDYRELLKLGKFEVRTKDEGYYSLVEIEEFLMSEWADVLARILRLPVSNWAILKQLRSEPFLVY